MGIERPCQAHDQRREAAAVARSCAAESCVEAALERDLCDAEAARASVARRQDCWRRRRPPSFERELSDHCLEAAARSHCAERRYRARVTGAFRERPGRVSTAVVRGEELVDQEAPGALAAARQRVEDEQLGGRIGTTCRPRKLPTPGVVDTSTPERQGGGDRLHHRALEEPLFVAGHLRGRVANAARRRGCGAGRRAGVVR